MDRRNKLLAHAYYLAETKKLGWDGLAIQIGVAYSTVWKYKQGIHIRDYTKRKIEGYLESSLNTSAKLLSEV